MTLASLLRFLPKRMACGGTFFHLHGHDNQITICRPCNDNRIFELECALEAALKTIAAIDERRPFRCFCGHLLGHTEPAHCAEAQRNMTPTELAEHWAKMQGG